MPKKRIRVGLLSGSILLLTASRPTKSSTTEVSVQGTLGQMEDKELAGTHTYSGSGGCSGTSGETVKVYRHYQEKQVGGTVGVVHTTASNKTVSAEVSAYETTRVQAKLVPGDREWITTEADYSQRREGGTVTRLGSTRRRAHWELGTALYQVKDKTLVAPSGMIRLGPQNSAYMFADVFGSSVIPLGSYASTGIGYEAGNASIEGKLAYGPRKSYGTGLEGQLPLGRRFRVKLGAMSYTNGEIYSQWQAYSGMTLIAGNGVTPKVQKSGAAKNPETTTKPGSKKRWIDEPTSSPFLNY